MVTVPAYKTVPSTAVTLVEKWICSYDNGWWTVA